MSPLKATTLWLLYSLGALALAHPDSNDTKLRAPALPKTSAAKVLNRRASDECTGDCATCFGSGFKLCASSSNTCYKPGDLVYGVDSCSGVGSSDVPTEPDVCTDGGCAVCFGSGYQDCPNSSLYCYKPGDSLYGIESCSADASSSSSGSSSGSGSDAASDTSSQTTDSGTSTASGSGASSTGSAGGVTGGSGDTEDTESSTTSTRSGLSSSATGGSNSNNNNQGSSANSDSNGSPAQNSSGNSEIYGGLIGVLFAGGVAFVAALHLRI